MGEEGDEIVETALAESGRERKDAKEEWFEVEEEGGVLRRG